MTDLTVSYKGNNILTANASLSRKLDTAGKYCEEDITIQYTRPTFSTQTKSVTPTESAQTVTPDSGYDGLSQVNVGAVSSTYVGTGVTRKSAQTYTPTTTDQTIASGQYLTGVQTIKGDANLLAENIKKGVVIFGITGTYDGDAPSSYTVTVSLTNPINPSRFSYCYISEQHSAADHDAGYTLGQIQSASGSTSVTVPSSLYGVYVEIQGEYGSTFYSNNISVTGGVSYIGWDNGAKFEVTGNGTITIDNVEYYDDD